MALTNTIGMNKFLEPRLQSQQLVLACVPEMEPRLLLKEKWAMMVEL